MLSFQKLSKGISDVYLSTPLRFKQIMSSVEGIIKEPQTFENVDIKDVLQQIEAELEAARCRLDYAKTDYEIDIAINDINTAETKLRVARMIERQGVAMN